MFFLVLLSTVAITLADYSSAVASDPVATYNVPSADTSNIGGYYQQNGYPSYPNENQDDDFNRLRRLHGTGIVRAKIRYYTRNGDNYAIITCPQNNDVNAYSWILVNSHETVPNTGVDGTAAIAGGKNVAAIAKIARHNKYEARDINQERRRFNKVGCYFGTDTVA